MSVLEEDSRVALSLQHPVPVKRVVGLQGTFKVLKYSKSGKQLSSHRADKSRQTISLNSLEVSFKTHLDY